MNRRNTKEILNLHLSYISLKLIKNDLKFPSSDIYAYNIYATWEVMLIKFPTSKITIPVHPSAAILSSANYHHRTKKKRKKKKYQLWKIHIQEFVHFHRHCQRGEMGGEKKTRKRKSRPEIIHISAKQKFAKTCSGNLSATRQTERKPRRHRNSINPPRYSFTFVRAPLKCTNDCNRF